MKRIFFVLFVLIAVIGLHAEELTVGTIRGMMIYSPAVVNVLKANGYETSVKPFETQDELIASMMRGDIDGAFFLAQPVIAQIKGSVMIPVRLMYSDFCAVCTDSSVSVSNPGDLRKYSVGIVKGHPGHIAVTRGMTTVQAGNDVEQFKQLSQGNFQVAIAVRELIPVMTKVAGIQKYYVQQPPLMRTPTFFVLGSGKANQKKEIESAFREALENGSWERDIGAAQ